MQVVPLNPVPNQAVTVTLGGQACQVDVKQKRTGVFLDLYVGGALVIAGALCQDRNPVVRSVYLGFVGDLAFIDTQGTSDPTFNGLGTRYLLAYLTAADFV